MSLELRVACRRLVDRPLTSLAVILSLAVGLALISLVLSAADRLLLRPLPVVESPDELVLIERTTADPRGGNTSLSWLDFEALRERLGTSSGGTPDVAAFYPTHLGLASMRPEQDPEHSTKSRPKPTDDFSIGTQRVEAEVHSDGYSETLRVEPMLGRWPRDRAAGSAEGPEPGLEVALSHELWLQLGGRPDFLGRSVRLQGHAVEVVGVLPAGFVGTDLARRPRVFVSISTFERLATGIDSQWAAKRDGKPWLKVMARFDSTSTRGQPIESLDALLAQVRDDLASVRPEPWQDRGLATVPLVRRAFGGAERRANLARHLLLLLVAIGCAVGVAYANASGLMAIRAFDRLGEWRVRSALGAGRRQLWAAASLEGLVLGLAAVLSAPLCVVLLMPLIRRLRLPEGVLVDVAVDARQLLPVVALGLFGALLLAATPALTLAAARRFGHGVSSVQGVGTVRQIFVAAQVALAFVAVGAAFQLLRTVDAYGRIDPGVAAEAADRLLAVGLDVGAAGHDGADALEAFHQIDATLRAVGGVESASLAATLPILDSGPMVNLTVDAEGAEPPPAGEHHTALHALVGSGYFSTVGRTVLAGRDFGPGDDAGSPPALVIDQGLARQLWGDRSALGRKIRLVAAEDPYTVAGVVEDGLYAGLTEERSPTLFMAHAQSAHSMIASSLAGSATVLVRLRTSPSPRLLRDVRAAVARVDPAIPVLSIRPLRDLVEEHYALERQLASILTAVAGALLLFCLLGIYGGLSHSLVHQRGELAVRRALGAGRRHVLASLAAPTARSLLLGLLAGVWLATPASALLEGLLFGVGSGSPGSWLAAGGVLLAAVLLAGFEPVRGALTLETAMLLRDE